VRGEKGFEPRGIDREHAGNVLGSGKRGLTIDRYMAIHVRRVSRERSRIQASRTLVFGGHAGAYYDNSVYSGIINGRG
jgi:hypothetical protein